MNDLKNIVKQHVIKYPKSQPQDIVKLVYQNEFGGGHMIADEVQSLTRLTEEMESITGTSSIELFEDIGNDIYRLNLKALDKSPISLVTINKIFIESSKERQGEIQSFIKKLNLLRELAKQDVFNFSLEELEKYLDKYKEQGYPIVSHSEVYRNAYSPAYRVITKQYGDVFALIAKVDSLLLEKNIVVAIDGKAGSGKTSLARLLEKIYDCNIIHMDDFFLPKDLRTESRLSEAGGNVHYERFIDEVVAGIKLKSSFQHRVFVCSIFDYGDVKDFNVKPLTIIEGSYSLHPNYSHIYDIKVFKTCSDELQNNRILKRNGEEMLKMFQGIWIPMENRYFKVFDIENECDFVFCDSE